MARRLRVAFALVATLAVTAAEACEPIGAYRDVVGAEPPGGAVVVVPVVVHIMERPGRDCEVRDAWTSDRLKRLFDGDGGDERTVASVWHRTPIRFVVRDIALHEYAPPPALRTSGGHIRTPATGPVGSREWESAFRLLVARFHQPGRVNVYVWTALARDQAGFGRSPRTGRGTASVWLGGKCVEPARMSPGDCARVAAHELGHALGLYHSGPDRCRTVQSRFRGICRATTEPCGERSDAERLMAAGEQGRTLCPAEAAAAVAMADELR